MLGKKPVTAQKRGETRALCLGLGMVACSVIMYFFIGITIVPLYNKSVWTNKGICELKNASIKEQQQCLFNDGSSDENKFQYPCLDIMVNLTPVGQVVKLYHQEETVFRNPKCSYIPPTLKNYTAVQENVEKVRQNFTEAQVFYCYYDPSGQEATVLLYRQYLPEFLLFTFVWPSLMLIGGVLIIVLVKISQYFSILLAPQYRTGI
ncbi:calcium-activated potassium channel subunit beta-1 isoform X1 [Podarcis muralis]|uniref:Potassium calcium-activated channel subfamily M regulatory beta subunit 1 n=1 Tax=Podarcis muralis TaxID=64176 RepID=A0A670JDG0_PODMU|nr:calcium-activated potassium channel subunit beta-1 [Podarcis muralis]